MPIVAAWMQLICLGVLRISRLLSISCYASPPRSSVSGLPLRTTSVRVAKKCAQQSRSSRAYHAFCAIVGSFCGFACAYILFCAAAMLATASETPRSVVFFPRPFAPFRAPHFLQYYSVLALVLLRAVSSGPSCRILAGLDRTSVVSGSPSCPAKGEELGTTA